LDGFEKAVGLVADRVAVAQPMIFPGPSSVKRISFAAVGPSGLVVIDLDGDDGDIPAVRFQRVRSATSWMPAALPVVAVWALTISWPPYTPAPSKHPAGTGPAIRDDRCAASLFCRGSVH